MKIKDLDITNIVSEIDPYFIMDGKFLYFINFAISPYYEYTISNSNLYAFKSIIKSLLKKIYFLIEKDFKILSLEKKDFIENNKNFSTESFNFSQPIDNPLEKLTTPINSQNATNSFKEISNFDFINSKSFDNISNVIQKELISFIEKNIQFSSIQKVNYFYVGRDEMKGKGLDIFFGNNFFVISRYNPLAYSPPNVRGEFVFILGKDYPNEQGVSNWLSNGEKLNQLNLNPEGFYVSSDFNISDKYYLDPMPLNITFNPYAQGYKINPNLAYAILKHNFNLYFSNQPWTLNEFHKFCFRNPFIN